MKHSILDALRLHAEQRPEKTAFACHDAPEGAIAALDYASLATRVREVAAELSLAAAAPGARVALLLPNSIEYVVALLGAQAAGLVPVPLMARPSNRSSLHAKRLQAVIADCSPALCVVPRGGEDDGGDAGLAGMRTIDVTRLIQGRAGVMAWNEIRPDPIAFLQYTSGSTASPKGVIVEHRNLIANSRHLSLGLGTDENTVFGSWLPLFHDMGLVGKVAHPLLLGASSHLMRPDTFVRHPRRWLEMISRERVRISAAPNFAYDRCIEHIADVDGLDLSQWTLALNGSEPVSAETLDSFAERFAPAGFRREYFQPVYGLAEATLFVTSRGSGKLIRELRCDAAQLGRGRIEASADAGNPAAKRCVSVGRTWGDSRMVIWLEREGREAQDGEVGEILLAGEHRCRGYFGREHVADDDFGAVLPDQPDVRYLRTGDLGVVVDGELYITGRCKDLIVLRGRNIYPEDVEAAVQGANSDFIHHGGAAIEVEAGGIRRLVLVQEVLPATDAIRRTELKSIAIAAVSECLQLKLDEVVLLRRGVLPKTTSGKIARSRARDMLLAGEFDDTGVEEPTWRAMRRTVEAQLAWWREAASRIDGRAMDERRMIAPHVVLDFGNHGLLGMNVPVEFGGSGLGVAGMMRVIRDVASVDLTLASFLGVHNGLGIGPLLRFGTEAQKARYLHALATGRLLGCFALTEAGAGSNLRAIVARADRRGDHWILRGRKVWIGSAAWSGVAVFFAQAYDEQGRYLDMTAFLVPLDAPGVVQGPETLTLGMRGMVQNELQLEDVQVGDDAVLGRVGHGYEVAQSTVAFGRLGVAVMALGCMQRMQKLLVDYAQQRTISTGTLFAHPVVARRIFQMQAAAAAIRAVVDRCCEALDDGERLPLEVLSALKTVSTELCWTAVDHAMQAFGGRGYDEENRIAQSLRDSRLLRIFEGSSEALMAHVGHSVERGDGPLNTFVLTRFPAATALADAFVARAESIHARAATLGGAAPRAAHVALGEAAGYLLLEAALVSEFAHVPDLAIHGAGWLGQLREQALAAYERGIDAPWMRGDGASIRWLSAQLSSDICDWRPKSLETGRVPAVTVVPVPLPASASSVAISRTTEASIETTPVAPVREVMNWLMAWISRRAPAGVGVGADRSFSELGMDSIDAVELIAEFDEHFGADADAGVLWQFPTPRELAGHLAQRIATLETPVDAPTTVTADDALMAMLEQELER